MFKEISINDIPQQNRSPNTLSDILRFMDSGMEAAEVFDDSGNSHALFQRNAYWVKRNALPVKVTRRGGRVFLIKK